MLAFHLDIVEIVGFHRRHQGEEDGTGVLVAYQTRSALSLLDSALDEFLESISLRNQSAILVVGSLELLKTRRRIFEVLGKWLRTDLLQHPIPHRQMPAVMAEDVGEHALALECVGQVDDDSIPLFCEDLVIRRVIATSANGLSSEVDESGLHRFRITAVGECTVEDWSVLVDLQRVLLEDDVILLARLGQNLQDSLQQAASQLLTGLFGEVEDVFDDGLDFDLAAWLEEVVNGHRRDSPDVWDLDEARIVADQNRASTGSLGVLTSGAEVILRIVSEDDDSDAVLVFAPARDPIEGIVHGIDGADAGEGQVDDVAITEAIHAEACLVALLEHIHDVSRRRLGAIEGGFRTEIEATDLRWLEAVAVDQASAGIGAHRRGVLVHIGDCHRSEAQSLVQFTIVRAAEFGEILHVEV